MEETASQKQLNELIRSSFLSGFFLMCLAIYAYKCDVPKEKLRRDMQQIFLTFQGREHENALAEDDIKSALEAYGKEYFNFTIRDSEALTDVRIDRNKRNGRKQYFGGVF